MKRLMPLLLLAPFILQSTPAYTAGEEGFAIESAEATLYRDGYAHISLRIHVNETLPEVTVPPLSNVTDRFFCLALSHLVPYCSLSDTPSPSLNLHRRLIYTYPPNF